MTLSSKRAAAKLYSDILQNMRTSPKTPKQLERCFKGVANHHRVKVLMYVAKHDSTTLDELATQLNCNTKTLSEHTRKLVQAGLINKKYIGRSVCHSLSPYGKIFYHFINTF